MNVHLYFLKLFGCMVCEAKANGYDVPVDIFHSRQSLCRAALIPKSICNLASTITVLADQI
jgi:hypothetical protein